MNVLWLCITLQKSPFLFRLKVDFQINQSQTSGVNLRKGEGRGSSVFPFILDVYQHIYSHKAYTLIHNDE